MKNQPLNFWHIALAAGLGFLFCAVKPDSIPGVSPVRFQAVTVGFCVVFLLLGGSYVLLKGREDDIAHFRATLPDTEEARLRLQKRHESIGVAGWSMAAGGLVAAVIMVWKIAT
jgi:hypothetical protein